MPYLLSALGMKERSIQSPICGGRASIGIRQVYLCPVIFQKSSSELPK